MLPAVALHLERALSEEKVETRSCAVLRVLPCRVGFPPRTSSHAVGPAPEVLWLPLPEPKSESVATPVRAPALPRRLRHRRHPSPSGPLMRFWPLQRVKLREATVTRHESFLARLQLAGLTSPDSATPAGFLNLLTSCSSRSPSSLISCWWRSWGFTFEGFPSLVAVQMFWLALSTSAGPSAGSSLAVKPPTPVQGFRHPASPLPRPVLTGTRDPCLPWRSSPRG